KVMIHDKCFHVRFFLKLRGKNSCFFCMLFFFFQHIQCYSFKYPFVETFDERFALDAPTSGSVSDITSFFHSYDILLIDKMFCFGDKGKMKCNNISSGKKCIDIYIFKSVPLLQICILGSVVYNNFHTKSVSNTKYVDSDLSQTDNTDCFSEKISSADL